MRTRLAELARQVDLLGRVLAHVLDEQERRQHHAHLDGDGQVDEDRQRDRGEEDGAVGHGSVLQQVLRVRELAQPAGHHHQDRGQHRAAAIPVHRFSRHYKSPSYL